MGVYQFSSKQVNSKVWPWSFTKAIYRWPGWLRTILPLHSRNMGIEVNPENAEVDYIYTLLYTNGTVRYKYDLGWTNIVQLAKGSSEDIFGLRKDGTVIMDHVPFVGGTSSTSYEEGFKDTVASLTNVSKISSDTYNVAFLKNDGTCIVYGQGWFDDEALFGDLSLYDNIADISMGYGLLALLLDDGTVDLLGDTNGGQISTEGWSNIVQVACGKDVVAGLRSDGKLLLTGDEDICAAGANLSEVVYVAATRRLAGIKSDGTVFAYGNEEYNSLEGLEEWTDIVDIAINNHIVIGLKSNGQLVANRDDIPDDNLIKDTKRSNRVLVYFSTSFGSQNCVAKTENPSGQDISMLGLQASPVSSVKASGGYVGVGELSKDIAV